MTAISANVSFHPVGSDGILFNAARQNFYLVDRTCGFIWCKLAEEADPADIAHELADRAGIGLPRARSYLDQTLATWLAEGVLANGVEFGMRSHPGAAPLRPLQRPRPSEAGAVVRRCRVLDSVVEIGFADPALAAAGAALIDAHATETADAVDDRLDVAREDRKTVVKRCGRPMLSVPRGYSLAPAVLAALIRIGLEHCHNFPALHAAIVHTPQGDVLLPGESGCGKSTLVAALWAVGREVLGDDTAILDCATMRVRPVTPYLCVKSGAWRHLAAIVPELAQARGYRRPDGKRARYLDLTVHWARHAEAPPCPVRAIVFPTYRRGAAGARCERLDPIPALWRIFGSLDPIGRRFAADDVDRIVRWVVATPCYALTYGATAPALRRLAELLP